MPYFPDFPISPDDEIINVQLGFLFVARDSFNRFEDWVQESVKEEFKGFHFKNSVRMGKIEFPSDHTVFFRLKLLDPAISPQAVADVLEGKLRETLGSLADSGRELWEDVAIFTLGNDAEARGEVENYLRKLNDE